MVVIVVAGKTMAETVMATEPETRLSLLKSRKLTVTTQAET
jgi:hypothetical protein